MEFETNEAILATQAALAQASQLAVQYCLSIVEALLLLVIGWWLRTSGRPHAR
jgi:small conductance mechanosensitive channel